jgi:hypothetical protein
MRHHQAGCFTVPVEVSRLLFPLIAIPFWVVIINGAENPDLPHIRVVEVFLGAGPLDRHCCVAAEYTFAFYVPP